VSALDPTAAPAAPPPAFRIGHGYDLHRLEPLDPEGAGRPFVLAGVHFDHATGPVGHSDGDTLYHALTDALLGAISAGDIGRLFPDTDPEWDGADSAVFVEAAVARVAAAGYAVSNVDITVICERPKLGSHREGMIENVAAALNCPRDRVSIKGKTHEGVDAVGEGRAVEVHVIALLCAVS
jgi:2-C-methyl-D-erythritol 2,4-cyclodiphosphate synthase